MEQAISLIVEGEGELSVEAPCVIFSAVALIKGSRSLLVSPSYTFFSLLFSLLPLSTLLSLSTLSTLPQPSDPGKMRSLALF